MIILGASGFAKEVLTVLFQKKITKEIVFFDDISQGESKLLFNSFPIISSVRDISKIIEKKPDFVLGTGSPVLRRNFAQKFESLGGNLKSVISTQANIGPFGNEIGKGVSIMTGVVLTSDIKVGSGVLLNLNCTVGHDCYLHDFVECSPGVHISGYVEIGENSIIGTGAVILPRVKIGRNCTIGAGSVVTRDIPDGSLVIGVPGKIIKKS